MNKSNKTAANIIMTIIIIWLLIPLVATIIYSLFADWTGLVPEGFTFSSYVTIFTNQAFLTAIYQTLLICVVPILITILIVLLALFVVTIYFPQFEKYLQRTAAGFFRPDGDHHPVHNLAHSNIHHRPVMPQIQTHPHFVKNFGRQALKSALPVNMSGADIGRLNA